MTSLKLSIYNKIFVSMVISAVVICLVGIFSMQKITAERVAGEVDMNDSWWGERVAGISSSLMGVDSEDELLQAVGDLKRSIPGLERVDIETANGRVVNIYSRGEENIRRYTGTADSVMIKKGKTALPSGNPGEMESGRLEIPAVSEYPDNISAAGKYKWLVIPVDEDFARGLRIAIAATDNQSIPASGWEEMGIYLVISLLAGGVVFYLSINLVFKRPLGQLLQISNSLATDMADLSGRINVGTSDELGMLGSTLNQIFGKISDIIKVIRKTADKVNFSAQSLSASTQEMNSITEETSLTVQNIAKSTDVQAHKVDDMIREIKNMERSVKQVANSAELAASAATNASETATRGGESADQAVKKINKIYEVINESAEIIQHLGDRSNQIGEIVDVITDIADQTNLLALNAAIEAARAGEAGSGFAVVADEVRKLAEGSARAAEEIATLIGKTQEDTQIAVNSIEKGSREVTEGRDVITRTGNSLDEIVEVLKSSSDMARRISAATKELSRGMKNVISSIDEISGSAEKNASSTQETAASMEQMTSSMEDVASSAQKLSDMAIQLREHVRKFKIGDESEEQESLVS